MQSDGGPQFISAEFQAFANNWKFKHSMSSPYHSQSNGKAESAVKIVKNFLKKSDDPLRAVLEWRNTPTSQINCSPVQRLMQRRTRASASSGAVDETRGINGTSNPQTQGEEAENVTTILRSKCS